MTEMHRGFCGLQERIANVTLDMQIYGRVCGWLNGRREDYDFHAAQLSAWESTKQRIFVPRIRGQNQDGSHRQLLRNYADLTTPFAV